MFLKCVSFQVLTENGESIDFGSIAEDCLAEQQLVLVNCGRSEVPKNYGFICSTIVTVQVSLHLKLKPGMCKKKEHLPKTIIEFLTCDKSRFITETERDRLVCGMTHQFF